MVSTNSTCSCNTIAATVKESSTRGQGSIESRSYRTAKVPHIAGQLEPSD